MTKKQFNLHDSKYFQNGELIGKKGGDAVRLSLPPFNQEQRDIIVGTMLGDGTMGYRGDKPRYAMKFEQSMEHEEYIFHLFEVFRNYVGTGPRIRFLSRNKDEIIPKSIWFRTFIVDEFKFYWDLFYGVSEVSPTERKILDSGEEKTGVDEQKKKLVKIVPLNIEDFLTDRVLAYWFMDDGTFHVDIKDKVRSYTLNTQGFTSSDNVRLKDALKLKFNIVSGIQKDKDKFRIGIWRESSDQFVCTIKPYLHKDFYYKIGED